MDDLITPDTDHRGHSAGYRRAGALAVALAAVGILTGACGGGNGATPSVASLGTPSASSPSAGASSTDAKQSVLAYSRCMRSHGIAAFPDPDSSGDLSLHAGPGTGIEPDSAQYKAADEACKALMPVRTPPPGLKAANLKYSQCMRSHGIADFPDPQADGSLQVQSNPGSDLDPDNPQFKSADEACKQFQPNAGKGGGTSASGGK
jgi:hypothetical protein